MRNRSTALQPAGPAPRSAGRRPAATGRTYGYGPHREGLEVGSFETPTGAGLVDYRITATAAAESSPITLAVTTFDVAGTNRLRTVGVVVLLAVNLGAAGVLVVWGARPAATR